MALPITLADALHPGGEVDTDLQRSQGQNLGGKVLDLGPGQNQEAGIVEHTPQVRLALRGRPADPVIALGNFPGRRTEADGAEQATLPLDQVAQLRTRQWAVAKIAVACDQAVPQA